MSGLEIRIPYVNYKTRTKGFPYRINVQPTEMSIQKNLQYYSNKVMLKSNVQPLNTTENDIEWSIVEGDNYCSINASTGELTIDSSAITQMVKVRAKSRSNSSLTEEREIVLTHREQPIIEDLNFDIDISGLQASYNFIDTETTYTFTASLSPSVNGYNVVFDVIEGNECFNITDINWENNQTTVTFAFNEPNEEDTVITLRFCLDKMKELTKDISFNVKTLVSDIIFDNIPESPYIPYELYSFDFSTDPIINFRNLDVSVISGGEYLDNWYTGNVVGTSGKFYFKRNSVEIPHYEQITIGFADPLDNTIHEEVSLIFENVNHTIDISGNKSSYEYNEDKTFYESFTWTETPNYNRELQVIVTQRPDNIIDYYTSDVSGGNGKFNFQTKSVSDEGWVNVRIQDPLTTSGKNATFTIQNNKVAKYIPTIQSPYLVDGLDAPYLKNVYVEAYGNNLQPAIQYGPVGGYAMYYSYFVYDTSDNNFVNEAEESEDYNTEPQKHYTGVNLYDTSLYAQFDFIPGALGIPERGYRWFSTYFGMPRVQYDLDSSGYIKYPINVDISTDFPGGTYFYYSGQYADGNHILHENGFRIIDINTNYMVLDSSHYDGNGLGAVDTILLNPSAIYTDIPHIKCITCDRDTYYTYFDPSNNVIQGYFDNITENKEIIIEFAGDLRYEQNRPADTDRYFYLAVDFENTTYWETGEMWYNRFYAPKLIDYAKNYLHLKGNNIEEMLYEPKPAWSNDPIAPNIASRSFNDPNLPYKMLAFSNTDFDGVTSGMVSPLQTNTSYHVTVKYNADIVPINYTINLKINIK